MSLDDLFRHINAEGPYNRPTFCLGIDHFLDTTGKNFAYHVIEIGHALWSFFTSKRTNL